MSSVQDRYYQAEATDAAFGKWEGGSQSTLLILPTGTGKTVVSGKVCRRAIDQYQRRSLFLAHREELITQAADKLSRFDLSTAIEMADQRAQAHAGLFGKPDVVIGTIQTLQRRRLQSWDPREFGLIVVDEAHHAKAATYLNTLGYFKDYWLLGITATADRGDGQNLGSVFENVCYEYKLRKAIEDGYLVPLVTARLHTTVDLRNIKTTGGDYNAGELEARIAPHIEELADAIVKECGTRQTVVFCPDVGSSEAMADAMTQLGVKAEAVSGNMQKVDRRDALRRFSERDYQAIVCCDLLTEGWDEPAVACVVVCRPTKKRNRYAQMIGRGTRPHPDSGKIDCLVIDFAWETTSAHELCTPVELFDDSCLDDEIKKLAASLMFEAGEKLADPKQCIDEAERIISERRKLKIKLTGRQATYKKIVYDPVGVGSIIGVPIKQSWDFNPLNPASEKQLSYLRKLGVENPEGLSRTGAGKMIDKLAGRREQGLATSSKWRS
jgi:superfamily II DNA or RNA helicase